MAIASRRAGRTIGEPASWPATYQGTRFRRGTEPVLHLEPPAAISGARQRQKLDMLAAMNRRHALLRDEDPELEARIASYELAYRMQSATPRPWTSAPRRPRRTRSLASTTRRLSRWGGRACWPGGWSSAASASCKSTADREAAGTPTRKSKRITAIFAAHSDKPIAGLLIDLKQRGLLDETLVIWGGEFGRTPMSEKGDGRDHNPYGFTMWMAGARLPGGRIIGADRRDGAIRRRGPRTRPRPARHDPGLLGLDHLQLTWLHNGRHERATINGGELIPQIYPG